MKTIHFGETEPKNVRLENLTKLEIPYLPKISDSKALDCYTTLSLDVTRLYCDKMIIDPSQKIQKHQTHFLDLKFCQKMQEVTYQTDKICLNYNRPSNTRAYFMFDGIDVSAFKLAESYFRFSKAK